MSWITKQAFILTGGTTVFREIRRVKQILSQEECICLLKDERRGVLSVLGDDDYPYGMPLNHYYNEEDGKLYFHSSTKGHRPEAYRRHDKASFCVCDKGIQQEDEWFLRIRSVIVFGRIEIIEDREKTYEIARRLSYKFTKDEEYIESEIQKSGPGTLLFALKPEHMTGKLVKES